MCNTNNLCMWPVHNGIKYMIENKNQIILSFDLFSKCDRNVSRICGGDIGNYSVNPDGSGSIQLLLLLLRNT